jgi:hypothetical protein
MNEERRSACLNHLHEASLCLDEADHAVLAARLQDIIGSLEQEVPDATPKEACLAGE